MLSGILPPHGLNENRAFIRDVMPPMLPGSPPVNKLDDISSSITFVSLLQHVGKAPAGTITNATAVTRVNY